MVIVIGYQQSDIKGIQCDHKIIIWQSLFKKLSSKQLFIKTSLSTVAEQTFAQWKKSCLIQC